MTFTYFLSRHSLPPPTHTQVSLHEIEEQAEYAKTKWGKVLWVLGLWFSVFAVLRLMVATYNLSKYLFFEYEGRTPPHYVEHMIDILQVGIRYTLYLEPFSWWLGLD